MKFLAQILHEADCCNMPEGERNFKLRHIVKKHEDEAGNGDDVFDGSNIKKDTSEEPASEEPEEQIEKYKEWNTKKEYHSFNEAATDLIVPLPAEAVPVAAKRRNYARDFSANREFKLMRAANGKFRWRRMPASAIVFFGKQEHEKTPGAK